MADEVKLWFNLSLTRTLYTKIKSNDYIKIHYDHGVRKWNGRNIYFYGTLNTNKSLNRVSLKAGVGNLAEKCNSDNRLKLTLQKDANQWHWYHRTMLNYNKYKVGILAVYDITNQALQKNNLLFNYTVDTKTDVFLRAEVKGFRKHTPNLNSLGGVFDTITADVIRKIDDKTKVGLEVAYDTKAQNLSSANLVAEHALKSKQKLKFSINKNLDCALLYKRPFYGLENIANIAIGLGVTGVQLKNPVISTGTEISINL